MQSPFMQASSEVLFQITFLGSRLSKQCRGLEVASQNTAGHWIASCFGLPDSTFQAVIAVAFLLLCLIRKLFGRGIKHMTHL